jgi:thiamine biosynthesis protein ThiS
MPLMQALHVSVNGESVEVPAAATVATVLAAHGLAEAPCAVEVNERLVPRREHGTHALRDGDRIEIVTLVGGG